MNAAGARIHGTDGNYKVGFDQFIYSNLTSNLYTSPYTEIFFSIGSIISDNDQKIHTSNQGLINEINKEADNYKYLVTKNSYIKNELIVENKRNELKDFLARP